MNKIHFYCSLLLCFSAPLTRLNAQMSSADALTMRVDMAKAVLDGKEPAAAAIARLAKAKGASGSNVDSGTDLALACMDLGHRLLVKDRAVDAVKFFKAAEVALAALVQVTPNSKAAEKANYLRQIAYIRGQYLGQVGQAKLDIDQAIALQPNDKELLRTKNWIGNSHGAVFNELPPGTPKK